MEESGCVCGTAGAGSEIEPSFLVVVGSNGAHTHTKIDGSNSVARTNISTPTTRTKTVLRTTTRIDG